MLIKVKVFPKLKKQEIIKKSEDVFWVRIKETPERGLANKAVVGVLADYFKISQSSVKMIKGAHQRNKIFNIKL